MVKAKDLLNQQAVSSGDKTPEDLEQDEAGGRKQEAGDEHEQVHEAYENITKRLEALRNGSSEKNEDEDEDVDKEDDIDPLDKDEDLSEKEIEEKNEEEEEEMSEAPANAVEPIDEEARSKKQEASDERESKDEDDEDKPFGLKDQDENKEVDEEDLEEFNDKDESEEPEESKDQVKSEEKEETLDDLASGDMHIPPLGGSPASAQEKHSMNEYNDGNEERDQTGYPSDYKSSINRYPLGGERPRRASKLHLLILILIGLAVIGGTVYLLKNQFSSSPTPSPAPSATSEPSPTPSPTPEAIDRSKFKVRVLNGTTTSGLAKTVSEKLKGLGYQEDRVGNAPKQDFEVTEIKSKASATGLADQLLKDLSPDYSASISAELKETDTADAEVIIGKK